MLELLTRDQFREGVFARDGHKCVICKGEAQDAHHIIERRLWPNGGYYLDNGASLCGVHHLAAEATTLSVAEIRLAIGCDIHDAALPPHLYRDTDYDKWGNVILGSGQRLIGELFYDSSVQKALAPVLHLFTNRVKYPRTYHLPWSPGCTDDDRMLSDETLETWKGDIVITEKMDGENTTMYSDFIHARSLEFESRFDRDRIKALHGRIGWQIDADMRVCGENLTAKHSLKYDGLPHYFMVFGVWVRDVSLPWDDVVTYAALLGLPTVPVLLKTKWENFLPRTFKQYLPNFDEHEGYVVRPAGSYTLQEHRTRVGKYVRRGHVADSHGHWTRHKLEWNGIVEGVE